MRFELVGQKKNNQEKDSNWCRIWCIVWIVEVVVFCRWCTKWAALKPVMACVTHLWGTSCRGTPKKSQVHYSKGRYARGICDCFDGTTTAAVGLSERSLDVLKGWGWAVLSTKGHRRPRRRHARRPFHEERSVICRCRKESKSWRQGLLESHWQHTGLCMGGRDGEMGVALCAILCLDSGCMIRWN